MLACPNFQVCTDLEFLCWEPSSKWETRLLCYTGRRGEGGTNGEVIIFFWAQSVFFVCLFVWLCRLQDLDPQPGMEPRPPALRVLTTGPPGKSLSQSYHHKNSFQSLSVSCLSILLFTAAELSFLCAFIGILEGNCMRLQQTCSPETLLKLNVSDKFSILNYHSLVMYGMMVS